MTIILFVCTGNAARSQMAEGLLKSMKPDFAVLSAGTKPEGLHPNAVKAMDEIGLDVSNQTSKGLDDVNWKDADFAITLCGSANETCVMMDWPESCKRAHWPIADPESLDAFRNARDEIKAKIDNFLQSIL
tara:strand:+ start:109 stop:501 length:393 start_codon:yes stop_codon:yes gene_type:complete